MKKKSVKQKEKSKSDKQTELEKLFKKSLKGAKEKNAIKKTNEEKFEEEEIDNVDMTALEFSPFLNPRSSETVAAPVLEKIAESQPIRQRFFAGAENIAKDDEIKYGAESRSTSESYSPSTEKYESAMDVEPPVLRADVSDRNVGTRILDRSSAFVSNSRQERTSESERFASETFDSSKIRNFENQEKKYKEFKPKRNR